MATSKVVNRLRIDSRENRERPSPASSNPVAKSISTRGSPPSSPPRKRPRPSSPGHRSGGCGRSCRETIRNPAAKHQSSKSDRNSSKRFAQSTRKLLFLDNHKSHLKKSKVYQGRIAETTSFYTFKNQWLSISVICTSVNLPKEISSGPRFGNCPRVRGYGVISSPPTWGTIATSFLKASRSSFLMSFPPM